MDIIDSVINGLSYLEDLIITYAEEIEKTIDAIKYYGIASLVLLILIAVFSIATIKNINRLEKKIDVLLEDLDEE